MGSFAVIVDACQFVAIEKAQGVPSFHSIYCEGENGCAMSYHHLRLNIR